MAEKLVPIASYGGPAEAAVARTKLEAAGLRCFLSNSDAARIHFDWFLTGAATGVDLLVPSADEATARAILEESPEEAELALQQTFGEMELDRCPRCGSPEVRRRGIPAFQLSIAITLVALLLGQPFFLLLIGLPVLLSRGRRSCFECGHRWREGGGSTP